MDPGIRTTVYYVAYILIVSMEVWGLEPQTYGMQSRRSSQLSYTPHCPQLYNMSQSVSTYISKNYLTDRRPTVPEHANPATLVQCEQ